MSQEGRTQKIQSRKSANRKSTERKKSRDGKVENNTQSDDDDVNGSKKKYSPVATKMLFTKTPPPGKPTGRTPIGKINKETKDAIQRRKKTTMETSESKVPKGSTETAKAKAKKKADRNVKKRTTRRSRRTRAHPQQQIQTQSPPPSAPANPGPQSELQEHSAAPPDGGLTPSSSRVKRRYLDHDEEDVELSDREVNKNQLQVAEELEVEKVSDLRAKVIEKYCKGGLRSLIKEYGVLKNVLPADSECRAFKTFEVRNRYADVCCLDSTRVVLKTREQDDDYIHASYVNVTNHPVPKYICAQGPTEDTIADFWHMVYHEDVAVIVMLCQFVEQEVEKCAEYYCLEPGSSTTAGEFSLTTDTSEVLEHKVVCKKITVKHRTDETMCKSVCHLFWAEWPDHLAPMESHAVLYLLRQVKARVGEKVTLVHCSAGIGRTGTFVAVDQFYDRLKSATKGTNVLELCKKFRQQRAHAVQSLVQYIFLHVCVTKLAIEDKIIKEDNDCVVKFLEDYKKYMSKLLKKIKQKKSSPKPARLIPVEPVEKDNSLNNNMALGPGIPVHEENRNCPAQKLEDKE
ncbi:unnamed protein product [Bursaphelenchus okinawaensis]|uniref:Tyrosine-protein phosphatase domain-containing protein n=1 Tax=Bursaphelenchus okinawaensis TaxID=465554 RepID=A0A811L9Z9_9BILA|nr:unnamed protein product [Bursaphelenchus okinawaensis]CAG9120505.1 unnamed protein product [Bursaphelenchus okinawaensis]